MVDQTRRSLSALEAAFDTAYDAKPWGEAERMRADCECLIEGPKAPELVRDIGTDPTNGRYADVTVHRCPACGQLWLRYFVEYEAFSRSGRWAEVPIEEAAAGALKPEDAAAYIDAAPWHIRGGSYWGSGRRKGTGILRWDL